MSEGGLSARDRELAAQQYRKSVSMAVVMGVLASVSVVSHFVSLFGAPVGIFPVWMTIVTVLLFAFTVVVALGAKARRDEVAWTDQARQDE